MYWRVIWSLLKSPNSAAPEQLPIAWKEGCLFLEMGLTHRCYFIYPYRFLGSPHGPQLRTRSRGNKSRPQCSSNTLSCIMNVVCQVGVLCSMYLVMCHECCVSCVLHTLSCVMSDVCHVFYVPLSCVRSVLWSFVL